jgi:SAM-dependent methyltransferase
MMNKTVGFSKQWEDAYSSGGHDSLWPWTDLVSLVSRYCCPISFPEKFKVLELGCGPGANIPFFLFLKVDYHAIDGSITAINKVHTAFPSLSKTVVAGDFTREYPFSNRLGFFDLIVDRAAITHSDKNEIETILKNILFSLKQGGVFVGVDWFSKKHSDSLLGVEVNDENTRTNIMTGECSGIGKVHFSDEKSIRNLFSSFDIILLEEKVIEKREPLSGRVDAFWNIVAKKR